MWKFSELRLKESIACAEAGVSVKSSNLGFLGLIKQTNSFNNLFSVFNWSANWVAFFSNSSVIQLCSRRRIIRRFNSALKQSSKNDFFYKKFDFVNKNWCFYNKLIFLRKFYFIFIIIKILFFFLQKFRFCLQKFRFLQIFWFLTKILIYFKNLDLLET